MRWVNDPRLISYVIMCLYCANSIRWAFAGEWAQASYWLSALGITASVTFGMTH